MNFYSVIIGTELLNGRRKDAHFAFLNSELLKRGWEQKASFVIDDDPSFIENIFKFIKSDKDSVMFCFGGIGATPDDHTRKCAANVFTDGSMEVNEGAKKAILDQFGSDAYPHRINMANLPVGASLLKNVVTNVPGFYLENRFFFTPGFPSMSQSMVIEALEKHYKINNNKKVRFSLVAKCSENELVDTMKMIPNSVELSSLPRIIDDKRLVEISIASYTKGEAEKYFNIFLEYLNNNLIEYSIK
jgi:molybdopterin-biosynthesis enzyme MoeA-like protein